MNDTSRSNKYRLLVVSAMITLIVVLIIVSKTPAMFLSWFLNILAAFSLLLLFVFVFVLVVVVIGVVLHRYIEKRRQESDDEPADQQSLRPLRRAQYIPRRQRRHQPSDEWEDSDY